MVRFFDCVLECATLAARRGNPTRALELFEAALQLAANDNDVANLEYEVGCAQFVLKRELSFASEVVDLTSFELTDIPFENEVTV